VTDKSVKALRGTFYAGSLGILAVLGETQGKKPEEIVAMLSGLTNEIIEFTLELNE